MRAAAIGLTVLLIVFAVGHLSQGTSADKTPPAKADDPKTERLRAQGFLFLELYTQDMAGYIAFFQEVAGFKLIRKEGTFAELRSERGEILLNGTRDKDLPKNHPFREKLPGRDQGLGVEVGIVVDDLDKAFAAAKACKGWTVSAGIVKQSWGARDFRMLSPDGYYVRVTDVGK